jgi:type IV pilus assembly protein PilW
VGLTKKADGTPATILRRDGNGAPIRRLHVSLYYVSPCSQQTCGSGGGDGIPTLKRKDRITNGTADADWTVFPLVSGIEFMQVDIGVDTSPAGTPNVSTGSLGDGVADELYDNRPLYTGPWNSVVALRVYLLARSLEPTPGFSGPTSYSLGLGSVSVSGSFKRKMFSKEIRLNNPSGRRERVAGEY